MRRMKISGVYGQTGYGGEQVETFFIQDGYLFKGKKLCVPSRSLRHAIIKEQHGSGLGGHFGRDKTIAIIEGKFYWPKIYRDVARYVQRCKTCHTAKGHSQNTGLHTPFAHSQCSMGGC